MNRNCTACNIMIDVNNYKKDRTVCKSCYNISKRKNNNVTLPTNKINTSYQQPNVETLTKKIQILKIIVMSLLVQATLAKLIICSKYLKK